MKNMLNQSRLVAPMLGAILFMAVSSPVSAADALTASDGTAAQLLQPVDASTLTSGLGATVASMFPDSTINISAATSGVGQGWSASTWYVKVDGSVAIVPDITASASGFTGVTKLDPGFRLGVAAGDTFWSGYGGSLSAEFETGIIYNSLRSVTVSGNGITTTSVPVSGTLWQVPLLANLVGTFDLGDWQPYIGVGGGATYLEDDITSVAGSHVYASANEMDPAVQVLAGIRYKINNNSEIGLSYKYLMVFANANSISSIASHSIGIQYTYRF